TTLLNQLQGLDRPTSGEVKVLGLDPVRDRRRLTPRVGSQLQEATTIPRLTVRECMDLFASFYPRTRDPEALLAELGIASKARSRVEQLSGGQRQRLFIGLALLHDPELLFFDELTSALDPQARLAIWDTLRSLKQQGRTIVLTTHSMEEAQALCDRIAIIDAGRIVTEGTPAELVAAHTTGSVLRLRTDRTVTDETLISAQGVTGVDREGVEILVNGHGNFVVEVLQVLAADGVGVTSLRLQEATLEDVFLTLTGRRLQGGE
ncbi:MAG: ABC transporter ATP-binding protein, partial [Actinomycetia bacterium]|nr:ABC transporter ATP-binding protein [Actinomycetes bacterium]